MPFVGLAEGKSDGLRPLRGHDLRQFARPLRRSPLRTGARMTFLLDENFPVSAAAFLRERGHEVHTVRETCGSGSTDEEVFAEAQARRAVLLTSDRDFYRTVPLLFGDQ